MMSLNVHTFRNCGRKHQSLSEVEVEAAQRSPAVSTISSVTELKKQKLRKLKEEIERLSQRLN